MGKERAKLFTFSPQGTTVGLQIGEKAETDEYMPGFLRWQMRAPCPPMLWPVMLLFSGSTGNSPDISSGSSWEWKHRK